MNGFCYKQVIWQSSSNHQQCLLCQQLPQTADLFLQQCPHESQQMVWEGFQQEKKKIYVKDNVLQPFQDLILEGYHLSCDDT